MNPTIGSKWTNVADRAPVWVVKELNPNGTVTVVSADPCPVTRVMEIPFFLGTHRPA